MNPIASTEKQLKRLSVCDSCPSISGDKKKCKECGCYLAYKIMLNNAKCPLNKWDVI